MVSALGLCGRRSRRGRQEVCSQGVGLASTASERTKDSGLGPNALFPENINAFRPNGRRVRGLTPSPRRPPGGTDIGVISYLFVEAGTLLDS